MYADVKYAFMVVVAVNQLATINVSVTEQKVF